MILISHRGNLNGPNPKLENHPNYISAALMAGFNAELDVWYVNGKYVLGHDKPEYEVGYQFFYNSMFWCHCKNIEALYKLSTNPLVNSFFHDKDDCVLTSQGLIWTFPRNQLLTNKSIAVLPELVADWQLSDAYGICTDYPIEYKKDLNFSFDKNNTGI